MWGITSPLALTITVEVMYFSSLISTWNSDLTCHPFSQGLFWTSWTGTGLFVISRVFQVLSLQSLSQHSGGANPCPQSPLVENQTVLSGGDRQLGYFFYFLHRSNKKKDVLWIAVAGKSRQDILLTPASASPSLEYQQVFLPQEQKHRNRYSSHFCRI